MNNFNDIKKFREDYHLTQKELADQCGVTLRTVQNWEAGRTVPDNIIKLLQKISGDGETVSAISTGKGTSIATGKGGKVNMGGETEKLLSLLEHSQMQMDKHIAMAQEKDQQISRLISIIENMRKD